MKDLYQILEISGDATIDEIKKAYRKLALQYHPDRNSNANAVNMFREITEAYEILSNPEKRKVYDEFLFNSESFKEKIINAWKDKAQAKAKKYTDMDYELFRQTLIKEMKLAINFAPNFGCLIFILVGVILGIYLIVISIQDHNSVGAGILTFSFYLILAFIFYPKIIGSYRNSRKNL